MTTRKFLSLALSLLLTAALFAGCTLNDDLSNPEQLDTANDDLIDNNPDGNVQGGTVDDLGGPATEAFNSAAQYRHELNIDRERFAGQTLSIWTFWEPDGESDTIAAFEAATGARVEFVNAFSFTEYNTNIIRAIATGDGPDICVFAEEAVPAWVMRGYLFPLNNYIDFSKVSFPISRAIVEYYTFNGNLYAMPDLGTESNKMYFRRDIFANSNVDNPFDLWKQGRWTWDEFVRVALEIQQNNRNADGENSVWGYYSWSTPQILFSNGANHVQWMDGNPVEGLSDPKAVRALEWDRALEEQHNIIAPWDPDLDPPGMLVAGNIAMMYWGDWLLHGDDGLRAALGDNLGIAPFPRGPDLPADIPFGEVSSGHKEGIAGSSKNPELAALYLLFKRLPADEDTEAAAEAERETEILHYYGSREVYEMCVQMEYYSKAYAANGFTGLDNVLATIRGRDDMTPAQAVAAYAGVAQHVIDQTWEQ
ncbi:MAG: extracellular solute-binding protein [Oscillospiraceae bacterium]|nr:extracellular solute-binding protein [Oscillospiraceae bacterium]